jgi:ribosome-associated protein
MEDSLVIAPGVEIPLSEVELRASRSSGPGGQHANVTASRVEAVFDVEASRALTPQQRERLIARAGTRVSATAQDTRSQARNRELALARLRRRLAAALREPRPRRPTRPTAASRARRLEQKRRASERKRTRRPPADEQG